MWVILHRLLMQGACVLSEGKADGVRAIEVKTGGGLHFTVHSYKRHGYCMGRV